MSEELYIPRTLIGEERTFTEAELLATSKFVIVLAEPGGGKTDLLGSLAKQLGTVPITASRYAFIETQSKGIPLIVDGFDELAKIDASGIHRLLTRAEAAKPTHLVLSSRSSEWGTAATATFRDFLGQSPLVVRLQEFDEVEQRRIFDDYAPGEAFSSFQAEVTRFDLGPLLPNPQFLKLFADAYIASERKFNNKKSIFSQAVERLAREANPTIAQPKEAVSSAQKVKLAEEIFAKLLLSGAEGVSTTESTESPIYPTLATLGDEMGGYATILASKLFKPGDQEYQHRPVHKIVAEYCAANYLVRRIANPGDFLTLSKCLPIIAPNSTARDELRGLLGWMAALGNRSIQEAAIELDPYAVLANGDPSQLEESCKRQLIRKLKDIAENDPHFRRGDFWRRFSVAGFFTANAIDELRILLQPGDNDPMRELVLELLAGSPVVAELTTELELLVLGLNETENTRRLANERLLEVTAHDLVADATTLVTEGSHTALNIVAEIVATVGVDKVGQPFVAEFLSACARLYPPQSARDRGQIGTRYFVKRFIGSLQLDDAEWLLDKLSTGLTCTCGKKSFECDCRNGISKIIGSLMDRYFSLSVSPYNPIQVWQWTKDLNFHQAKGRDQSASVRVIQTDTALRQGILTLAFGGLTDKAQISEVRINKFDFQCHSGLGLRLEDWRFVADLAFKNGNPTLWACFITWHQRYRKKEELGPDDFRRYLRIQANENPVFMREWAKANWAAKQQALEFEHHDFRHHRRLRRYQRKERESHVKNIRYLQENRLLVHSGRHWNLLVRFAELVLQKPEKIVQEFGDEELVRTALKNCLSYISEHVPGLGHLAELQCASQSLYVENILYAACLEILRAEGSLTQVEPRLLVALRTNIHMGHHAVSEEDRRLLQGEIDRLIFPDSLCAEAYLREYVEPQLAVADCPHPEVWQLGGDDVFAGLRGVLSLNWLQRFPHLAFYPLNELFEVAAEHADRSKLEDLIAKRCAELIGSAGHSDITDAELQRRKFWYLRAVFFLDAPPQECWKFLTSDRDTVISLSEISSRPGRHERKSWPLLSAPKVAVILDAFIDKWPKVALPSSWGTGDPPEETAYRYLSNLTWSIGQDSPDRAIPVLDRLFADDRFADFRNDLKAMRASQVRAIALRDFAPPTPHEIVDALDHSAVVTVEGLRAVVLDELVALQKAIVGGEFNTGLRFYENGQRLGEVRCTEIIAERFGLTLEPQGIGITTEHQLKNANRSDFTATKTLGGQRRLLVVEVKGQWHPELFTAADEQLYGKYSIHPNAEQQGIYLVLWFGTKELVAANKQHGLTCAQELREKILAAMPMELLGRIDVFVLDLSMAKVALKK